MLTFNTTQSDLIHLNGQNVVDKEPLSDSEYDFGEVGAMWLIRLESGVSIQCFDDELSE